jgi:hypothetical protein
VSERIERNRLNADLKAGRLMEQAIHQARLAYQLAPNTYTFECLQAVLRLQRRLQELKKLFLRPVAGEDTDSQPCDLAASR